LFGKIVIISINQEILNNDMSKRTRSKANYTDQHVGRRTQFNMRSVNYLSFQTFLFALNDATLFQGHGKSQAQDL
jgi:hypothetical protein